MTRILIKLLTVTVLLISTSCTTLNSAVGTYFDMDTDLEIAFKVDADINPDERKKPSPLFIRMYELKSTKMFNKADFIDLYERDTEVLGADLVSKQKLRRFKPGDSREDYFVLDKKTLYVALYAEFLQFKDSEYRVIFPVVANNVVRTTATINISANTISVQGDEDEEEEKQEKENSKSKSAKKSAKKAKKDAKKAKKNADKAKSGANKLKGLF